MEMNKAVSRSENGSASGFGVTCGSVSAVKTRGTGTETWTVPKLGLELELVLFQFLFLILVKSVLGMELFPGSGKTGLDSAPRVQIGSTTEIDAEIDSGICCFVKKTEIGAAT